MDRKILTGFFLGTVLTIIVFGLWLTKGQKLAGNTVRVEEKRELVDEESVVTKVVEKASPGVVTVSMIKTVSTDGFETGLFEQQESDIGTGFVISADGLVVTNKHVVSDISAKYKVVIGKDQAVDVVNIYRDPVNDLAILKVNKTDLTTVPLGDSDKLKVGQTVIAIGTALGEFRSTVTKGVISGLGRGIEAGSLLDGSEKLENVIQTDASINPGNSGGPLLNSSGEVIGVNVAVSQIGKGIGFALPINLVKESIDNFRTTGEFDRPYLGVSYQLVGKQAASANGIPSGAYARVVATGSPAEKAGIKKGDIIIEIDGNKLTDEKNTSLATYINRKKIGDEVSIKLWRDGKEIDLEVKLEKRPS